jgi:tRNA nucleotidyltransferase/poly(A) polymerase
MNEIVQRIQNLTAVIRKFTKADIFLFGSTLRELITTGKSEKIDIVINESDKAIQKNILSVVPVGVNALFDSKVDYSHEYFTMDNIFAVIDDKFDGNIELQSTNNGLIDLNKKIIKLTKAGKTKFLEDPHFVFQVITMVAENKFMLDSGTITVFLQNKNIMKDIDPKSVFAFVKNIVSYDHPRKIISLVNTLGISKEIFGTKLCETSIVNHLKPDDYYEFIAVIFSDVDRASLRQTLIGFAPKDVEIIKNISEAIASIEKEDEYNARRIINIINGTRIQSMIRLLYAMKFKTLAKLVRSQKECVFNVSKLCITEETIRSTFKIDDENEIKNLLDKALKKVILDPGYNDKYKILTYLNNERK